MAIFDTLHTDRLTCPWCGYDGEMTIQVRQEILPDAWQNDWNIGDTVTSLEGSITFDDEAFCPRCYARYEVAHLKAYDEGRVWDNEEIARQQAAGDCPTEWTTPVRVTIKDGVLVSITTI